MIKTNNEYQEATRRYKETIELIEAQRDKFAESGYQPDQIDIAIEPLACFQEQLREDMAWYDNVSRGNLAPISRLTDYGRLLISARIRSGLTQRALAEKLGVSEAMVSRDERNEYHGISLERAQRIMDALGARITISAEMDRAPKGSENDQPAEVDSNDKIIA